MRGHAERLITLAKHGLAEGGNNVHAHRLAAKVITDPEVTKRLFNDIAPLFVDRPGGYTRMVKIGPRVGDGAEMVVLELVERPQAKAAEETKGPAKAARSLGSRVRQAGSRLRGSQEKQ